MFIGPSLVVLPPQSNRAWFDIRSVLSNLIAVVGTIKLV